MGLHREAFDKVFHDLEWQKILGLVQARAATDAGRDAAGGITPLRTLDERSLRARMHEEALRLHLAGTPLPVPSLEDLGPLLERVRAGGELSAGELLLVVKLLRAAQTLRRFLRAHRELAATLGAELSFEPSLDDLLNDLSRAVGEDGSLVDDASPRLKGLRAEAKAGRNRIHSRLEELMRKHSAIVQEAYVTEREGRYVIPIRSDAHERFAGIVHAASASGATLFVEPRSVVGLGNRQKVLAAEVAREELAISQELTRRVLDKLGGVVLAESAVTTADIAQAVARLAADLSLSFPKTSTDAVLSLTELRHPLLVVELGARTVPSSVTLGAGEALVLSGPNAGGKTALMKAVGLSVLMAHAGLPIAAREGSVVGFFHTVLSDVGDDQSLQKNLSTFSAHIHTLLEVLRRSGSHTLILLDELCGGTDPREGEALAASVLTTLVHNGSAVIVTTHYDGLKTLALGDARFQNGSLGFDRLRPTFVFRAGVTGESAALLVAQELGMPEEIVSRARRFAKKDEREIDVLVREVSDERRALSLAREALEQERAELREAGRAAAETLATLRNKERHTLSEHAQKLSDKLREAERDLQDARRTLRKKALSEREVTELERDTERLRRLVALGGELEPRALLADAEPVGTPPKAVTVGLRVYVPKLRVNAVVHEVLPGGRLVVTAGALKVNVTQGEVLLREEEPEAPGLPFGMGTKERPSPPLVQNTDNTCDLRGLRVDDALSLAETFLDRALGQSLDVVFLRHGHGTGQLRDAIRKTLARVPYVKRFRGGDVSEGGEGVTVAFLG